jgi:hypothetical protein
MTSMQSVQALVRTAVGAAALLALSACGGGGGSPSSDKSQGNGASGTTLSGVAAKGLLKQAIVTAYVINANGVKTLLDSVTTTDTGAYKLVGLPAGEVIEIEVTADANTKMADEATGTDITPAPGFKLRAAKVLGAGTDTLQVTPYSEMAVAAAEPGLGLTKERVTGANASVVKYVGVDVVNIVPTFDAKNKPTNSAGLVLAAVARLAADGTVAGCASTDTQAVKVKCVVDKLAAQGTSDATLSQKLDDARRTVDTNGVTPPVATQANPVPVSATAKSAIDEAKTLIANVRNVAANLAVKGDPTTLPSRLQAVESALQNTVAPFDDASLSLLGTTADGLQVADDPTLLGGFPVLDGVSGRFELDPYGALNVTCQFFSDAFVTRSTSFADVKVMGCRVTHKVVPPMGAAPAYAIQHRILFIPNPNSSDQYQIQTSLIKQTGTIGTDGRFQSDNAAVTPLAPLPATVQNAYATRVPVLGGGYNSFTFKGSMAPGLNKGQGTPLSARQDVDVALASSINPDGNTKLALKGLFSLIDATGATLSSVNLLDTSYLVAQTVVPGDVSHPSINSASVAHLDIQAVLLTGVRVAGSLDLSNIVDMGNDWNVRDTLFKGVLIDANGAELFNGALGLSDKAGTSDCLGCVLTVKGKVLTVGTNFAQINASLSISATSGDDVALIGSIEQGKDTILIQGRAVVGDRSATFLSARTPSGVGFTVHPNDTRISLLKGSELLGIFQTGNSRLTFADNSYEQF